MGSSRPKPMTENFENATDEILDSINYHRTRKLAMIIFLANLIFLLIDYLNEINGFWLITEGYKYLFYSHVLLGLVTLLYLLVYKRILTFSANKVQFFLKVYVISFALFILCLSAVISGWIDQEIHGQITVFIISCLSIAVLYYLNPKVTALIYGLSGVAFSIFLTFSQQNPMVREGHYINALLFVCISYFLSVVLFNLKHKDLLHKYYLEDLVTQRTQELQTANDLLTQEILERQRAETEMARLDRLNIIGEMAASISHEVRNPMTTVKGFLQLLKDKQETRDQEFFDLMIEELDRANSILSEFLSMSRTKATLYEWQNINDIVTSTLPLVQADAQINDKLLTIDLENVPDLQLNIQEIRQLLVNLVRNGLEAMSSGGQLRIRTFATNAEVVLVVSDEGHGIELSMLEKVGTPFYTTKEQGTGLGLAVCYGIVSRHNGRIRIETSPKGSTFYVYFNLHTLEAVPRQPQ